MNIRPTAVSNISLHTYRKTSKTANCSDCNLKMNKRYYQRGNQFSLLCKIAFNAFQTISESEHLCIRFKEPLYWRKKLELKSGVLLVLLFKKYTS